MAILLWLAGEWGTVTILLWLAGEGGRVRGWGGYRSCFIDTSENVSLKDRIKMNRKGAGAQKSVIFTYLNSLLLNYFHITYTESHKSLNKLFGIKTLVDNSFSLGIGMANTNKRFR